MKSAFWVLKFFSGMCWWAMAIWWINSGVVTDGSPIQIIVFILFIGIGLAIAFMGGGQGYVREKNGERVEGFRFQVPRFLRGENQDENGNEKPRVTRRERMSNYLDRVNDAVDGRRDIRR
jgi:hypothetical protein